jgi:glutamate/tyrosine decarboxylase-like PLP-dependent enzyme
MWFFFFFFFFFCPKKKKKKKKKKKISETKNTYKNIILKIYVFNCSIYTHTHTPSQVYTYEMAPVFNLMETEVLAKMRSLAGWTGGEGIFAPGGSYSNLMAINTARHALHPEVKEAGMSGLRLVMFSSEQAHYSMAKAASALGIGSRNCIKVPCDAGGCMKPEALARCIDEAKAAGGVPFCVVATAGATVTGAFDPIRKIIEIARPHGLWVHVDGAWGGAVLFSEKHRYLVDGVADADSMTWNPHKMMGVPQQCSALLLRKEGHLEAAHAARASYLFQKDKNHAELDTGDKTLQCGRLPDVFKLWCSWKTHGDDGYRRIIDHAFDIADHLRAQIAARPEFEMAIPGRFVNVCFYYLPPAALAAPTPEERARVLHAVAPFIKNRMQQSGTTMVGYQPLGDLPQFFRMVNMNPIVETTDMDTLLDLIVKFGLEWEAQRSAN